MESARVFQYIHSTGINIQNLGYRFRRLLIIIMIIKKMSWKEDLAGERLHICTHTNSLQVVKLGTGGWHSGHACPQQAYSREHIHHWDLEPKPCFLTGIFCAACSARVRSSVRPCAWNGARESKVADRGKEAMLLSGVHGTLSSAQTPSLLTPLPHSRNNMGIL